VHKLAILAPVDQAGDFVHLTGTPTEQVSQQLCQRQLAFADDNHFGPSCQIFLWVVGRLWPTDNHGGSQLLANARHPYHPTAGDQICIDADNGRPLLLDKLAEGIRLLERAVKEPNVETSPLQVRRQIEDTQGRVGLHDRLLLGVLHEKIAVSE
jgi:hypothetical protein